MYITLLLPKPTSITCTDQMINKVRMSQQYMSVSTSDCIFYLNCSSEVLNLVLNQNSV